MTHVGWRERHRIAIMVFCSNGAFEARLPQANAVTLSID
jgi:hypothetical protein